MLTIRNLLVLTLALVMLVACGGQTPVPPTASPGATSVPSNTPVPGATATTVPPTPGPLFAQGLSTEPLDVVATQPADKTTEVPVTKEQTRIIVQFNHPVVPLTSIDAQKDLPQPLTLAPSVTGEGRWLNTSTYVFSPTQNLAVATAYNASLAPLKDMLGQSLSQYAWTFKTATPGIVTTYPADNTKYAGVSQPITITFNTEMDRDTAQARFSVKNADTNATVSGKFEWQGVVLRFIPDRPLDYDKSYTAQLDAGAKDINKAAETGKNVTWRFTTTKAPG
ncbi:MAG TPA: Ig-like domain-containing protein, partial [Anaerolineae bacterium]